MQRKAKPVYAEGEKEDKASKTNSNGWVQYKS